MTVGLIRDAVGAWSGFAAVVDCLRDKGGGEVGGAWRKKGWWSEFGEPGVTSSESVGG